MNIKRRIAGLWVPILCGGILAVAVIWILVEILQGKGLDWTATVIVLTALASWGAYRSAGAAEQTLSHQHFMALLTEYRSDGIQDAIQRLKEFQTRFNNDQLENVFSSMLHIDPDNAKFYDVARRRVVQFYQQLSIAWAKGVIPEDLLKRAWSKYDLQIIKEILEPLENAKLESLKRPRLKSDCDLLRLGERSDTWE